MSTLSDTESKQSRAGMNCLLCRRRKLKCDRIPQGCIHCHKSNLPCVYPEPEPAGVKKKRGPYKKDKPPREKHLEDLVKYLEPRTNARSTAFSSSSPRVASLRGSAVDHDWQQEIDNPVLGNSEGLVKDALVALTRPSASERETRDLIDLQCGPSASERECSLLAASLTTPATLSSSRIFEYWQIFVARVDPLTKIVHVPTLAKRMLDSNKPAEAILMTSVYFAAVTSCTLSECQRRFGESRCELQTRYARLIETGLDNYGAPTIETLQALVLYILAVRRADIDANVRALFVLAVRVAQMIGLHEDPSTEFSPFERQLRRRLWWQLAGLESRSAEEGNLRAASILDGCNVEMPANLLDIDLDPAASDEPVPRDGVTDMTFVLARLHIISLVHEVRKLRAHHMDLSSSPTKLRNGQNELFRVHKTLLEARVLRYLHHSRPLDYMCAMFSEAMLLKVRLLIDHPHGDVPTKDMSPEERLGILKASVDIINVTHTVPLEPRLSEWSWYFRGYVQWHAFAVVIAELGYSKNSSFSDNAWRVVGPILKHWESTYQEKRHEPAWDHVNMLISRARNMRSQGLGRHGAEPMSFQTTSAPRSFPVDFTSIAHNSIGGDYAQDLVAARSSLGQDAYAPHSQYQTLHTMSPHVGSVQVDFGNDIDLSSLDDLDNIDYAAFDAVFGSTWDFHGSSETVGST